MTDPPTLLLSGREALVRNARDKACMGALARAIGGVRVVQGGILAAGRGGPLVLAFLIHVSLVASQGLGRVSSKVMRG